MKLALNARMTCSFGNPIETISLIEVSSAEPAKNELEESLLSSFGDAAATAAEEEVFEGAGVSASVVEGAEEAGAGPGAFGATGRCWFEEGAGVAGTAAEAGAGVAGVGAGAGAAFGFVTMTTQNYGVR